MPLALVTRVSKGVVNRYSTHLHSSYRILVLFITSSLFWHFSNQLLVNRDLVLNNKKVASYND
ncbi:hypothetical protein D1Z90_02115 [Motilimonas pumila]|uniref:Uncharacterized protein n=1 Tax=Motilimonas pumila TaxID=2303987 RepID=A0A418YKS1_9GAMM|nr:hypothetical protein D1Z90_02115 [Motilimonas pumila]